MAHVPLGRVVLPRHGEVTQPLAVPKKFEMRDLIGTREQILKSAPPKIPSITKGICDPHTLEINTEIQKKLGYEAYKRIETPTMFFILFRSPSSHGKAIMVIFWSPGDEDSHVVALFDRGDHHEYYDSMGDVIPKELEELLNKRHPKPIKSNRVTIQGAPSCLNHALIRLAFSHLNNDEYNALVLKTAKETGFTPEEAVVALSNNVFKGVTYGPGVQTGMGKSKKCRKCGGIKI